MKGLRPKYSIIVPTMGREQVKKCYDSLVNATIPLLDTGACELIFVFNGCTDRTTVDYIREARRPYEMNAPYSVTAPGVKVLEYPDPLGYPAAVNIGIGVARGEFIVLFNDDAEILEWGKDGKWLAELNAPFSDRTVGVTGAKKLPFMDTGRSFVLFFCAMVRASLFYEIGTLDEAFEPGGGEDIDFCFRCQKHGYRTVCVPEGADDSAYTTTFPIYHQGGKTVHTLDGWEEGFQERMLEVKRRVDTFQYDRVAKGVVAHMSTKGHRYGTMSVAVHAVLNQTLLPERMEVYFDDYTLEGDFEHAVSVGTDFEFLLQMADKFRDAGSDLVLLFGGGGGQVKNHQKALVRAGDSGATWLWRLDDDTVPEVDVLEKLLEAADERTGAVGGSVLYGPNGPSNTYEGLTPSGKIGDIRSHINMQWMPGDGITQVDHLYSSFLYRVEAALSIGGYCTELSWVGHREETILTHEIKRAGWDLLVRRDAVTWHYRSSRGGIRSDDASTCAIKDEAVFNRKMAEWSHSPAGTPVSKPVMVNLNCGMGDHVVFLGSLERCAPLLTGKSLVLYVCYPDILKDSCEKLAEQHGFTVRIASVRDGEAEDPSFRNNGLYAWCEARKWKGHVADACDWWLKDQISK